MPINHALGFGQRLGHRRQAVILGLGRDRACQPGRQRGAQQRSALLSQAIHQRPARLAGRDRQLCLAQNRPGVHARIHQHDCRAGFHVAGEQRAGHRGRAAVARQEGRVHIEAPVARQIEHGLRQDQAIRGHRDHIRLQRGQRGQRIGLPQRAGLLHRQIVGQGKGLDRRSRRLLPAARRFVRACQHPDHLPTCFLPLPQRLQDGQCKRRRPHEN